MSINALLTVKSFGLCKDTLYNQRRGGRAQMIISKRCSSCLEMKPLTEFVQFIRRKYVIIETCDSCYMPEPIALFIVRAERVVRYQNIRAREYGCTADLTAQQWIDILNKSEGFCCYCNRFVGKEKLCLDHLIPVTKGGGTTLQNVVAACSPCNREKSDQLLEEWALPAFGKRR